MVKTRHSGDGQEEDVDEFISLQSRKSRRNQGIAHEENGYESDDSVLIESSMGRGRRTRRSTNQVPTDTESDEEDAHQKATRSKYRQRFENTPGSTMAKAGRWDLYGDPVESTRRRSSRCSRTIEVDDEVIFNGGYNAIRRSTRQRKLIYGTFNQNLIDKHLHLVSEPEKIEEKHPKKRRKLEVEMPDGEEEDGENLDMYTRVKRERRQVKRDMYGMPVTEEEKESGDSDSHSQDSDTENVEGNGDEEEEEEEDDEDEDKQPARSYFLREHKPRTILYEAPIEPKKQRSRTAFHEHSPPRSRRSFDHTYRSPALKSPFKKRKAVKRRAVPQKVLQKPKAKQKASSRRRAAFHGSSSTSSSSSGDSSDDERRFERRKSKSMARSRNRCLPMNLSNDDVKSGVIRDRVKIGGSLADVDPMSVDKSVNFEHVGGLGKHVKALKEMIVFPLLYPEVFEKFKIAPPRGVLFYGPPGTGKTLVARALANECSHGDRKVAFFMRKGADCLSKWVGESERQLRLLFDQAYQMRPSIIFFDEIDGLAPVRSSRQDQIHSSIVSTLLALMDGLDNRGEVVIIGATNRIDSIDPALRRPGRFDREFLFPLPSVEARKQILEIHTRQWNPKLLESFLSELGEKCVGYCGADLKALCTEAALHALRRRYPQIYTTNDKLELDVDSIQVNAKDFHRAMQNIVPTAQRSMTSPARSLGPVIRPLLQSMFLKALEVLQCSFPSTLAKMASLDAPVTTGGSNQMTSSAVSQDVELYSDDDDDGPAIFESVGKSGKAKRRTEDILLGPFLNFSCYAYQHPLTHRPRLLLCGEPGQGQTTHLAPALLHHLENLPAYVIDLPTMYAVSAKTPEESCAQVFREARRTSPSIIYLPHVDQWWNVISDTMRATFLALLQDMEPSSPLLLLATAEETHSALESQVQQLFDIRSGEVVTMQNPDESARREFFTDLLLNQTSKPPATRRKAALHVLEELPKAKPPEPRKLTDTERRRLQQQEESTLRELRLFLRDVLNKLARDRKFAMFTKPVDVEEVTDYYDIIKTPMDLSTMMSRIDLHQYNTVKEFLSDMDLICSNALEYNPDREPSDRAIRHRACALRDTANAIVTAELDADFEKLCDEIKESRKRRGEDSTDTIPSFYFTKPGDRLAKGQGIPPDYPTRYSRRVRGMNTEDNSPMPSAAIINSTSQNSLDIRGEEKPKFRKIVKFIPVKTTEKAKKYHLKQSPWCRPSRRRYKRIVIYVDNQGRKVNPESGEPVESSRSGSQEDQRETMEKQIDSDLEKTELYENDADKVVIDADEMETKLDSPKNSPPQRRLSRSPVGRSGMSPSRAGHSPSRAGHSPSRASNSPRTKWESASSRKQDSEVSGIESTSQPEAALDSHSKCESSRHGDLSPRSARARQKMRNVGDSESDAMDTSTGSVGTEQNVCLSTKDATLPSPKEEIRASKPEINTCMSVDVKKIEEVPEEEKEGESSPGCRLTRSRIHHAAIQRAQEELEASLPKLVVDQDKLKYLLQETTKLTQGFNIEQLEHLYSKMAQCIYIHRNEYDKTHLVRDLEATLGRASRY